MNKSKNHRRTLAHLTLALGLVLSLMAGLAYADGHKGKAKKHAKHRFKAIDTDKNGEISRTEFEAAQPKFEQIDTDNSNALSKSELRSFIKKAHQKRKVARKGEKE